MDDVSADTPAQEKKFDFRVRIDCAPALANALIALIARADQDADEGLGSDDDDFEPGEQPRDAPAPAKGVTRA